MPPFVSLHFSYCLHFLRQVDFDVEEIQKEAEPISEFNVGEREGYGQQMSVIG
jgi:hypothetical protein